ncbi:hypothetical protein DPMN_064328 [Dreissena polymorpha]|uniref:Uncharacterized protein n=1 Tax=Dreissena polymorpha TaxID=45954 RepID=A0A9D4CCJ7_DREPO|nr:hypothetical protein DPMN_064328 [Dreissena polymorpha]
MRKSLQKLSRSKTFTRRGATFSKPIEATPDTTRENTGQVANHRSLSAPALSLTGSGCPPEEVQSLGSLAETEREVGDS